MPPTIDQLSADSLVLAEFSKAYQEAADPDAVLATYCSAHPDQADEMRELAKMMRGLAVVQDEPPRPLPELPGLRVIRRIDHGGMGEIYEAEQEPLGRQVAVKVIRSGRNSPAARERFLREQQVLARLHQTHIVPIHAAGAVGDVQYFVMPFIKGATLSHVVQTGLQQLSTPHNGATPTLVELAEQVARTKDPAARPTVREAPTSRERVGHVSNVPLRTLGTASTQPLPAADQAGGPLHLSADYFRSVAKFVADAAEALQHAHDAKPHAILHRDLKPSNLMIDVDGHCWIIDFGLAAYVNEEEGARK